MTEGWGVAQTELFKKTLPYKFMSVSGLKLSSA